jgi:uncharacterized membrane protein
VIKSLVAAAVIWPLVLSAGAAARMERAGSPAAAAVYTAAGLVCHQRDERSFHTYGVKWPVCARCSGLYLAAPLGAFAALLGPGRLRRARDLKVLALAAAPTAITFVIEHGGIADVSSATRFVAALPLGAAVAWVVVRAARGPETAIE